MSSWEAAALQLQKALEQASLQLGAGLLQAKDLLGELAGRSSGLLLRCLQHSQQVALRGQRRALEQAQELQPLLRARQGELQRWLQHLGSSKFCRLRCPEEVPSFADDMEQLKVLVRVLVSMMRQLPSPTVMTLAVVSLRLAMELRSVAAVASTALARLLWPHPLLLRSGLLAGLLPGVLAARAYGAVLMEDVTLAMPSTGTASRLAHNARRLPEVFWLATMISATAGLRLGREALELAIHILLYSRSTALLAIAVIYSARKGLPSQGGRSLVHAKEVLAWSLETLPPSLVRTARRAWHQIQEISRETSTKLSAKLTATNRSPVSPCSSVSTIALESTRDLGPVFHGQSQQYDDSDIID